MIARFSTVAALIVSLWPDAAALAQPAVPQVKPTVGQISDEVALQRLRMVGIENPRVLRREGTDILAQGRLQGRDTTFRMEALQGHLVDTAAPGRVLGGPGAAVDRPLITGPQVTVPRSALSEPALMSGAANPVR